jgi:hypothetical protein
LMPAHSPVNTVPRRSVPGSVDSISFSMSLNGQSPHCSAPQTLASSGSCASPALVLADIVQNLFDQGGRIEREPYQPCRFGDRALKFLSRHSRQRHLLGWKNTFAT